jgi:uncharacterized repeat protein (TIGR03803 family)
MNTTKASKFRFRARASTRSRILPALIAGLGLMLAGHAMAQTFTTLYSFTNGTDGDETFSGLVLSGDTLYGTAEMGGTSGDGAVFAVHTDGTGFTNLYSFTETNGATGQNNDGANPYAGLILSGNTLYGTAYYGGSSGHGTVFAVHTDGTGFTTLHSFTDGSDGANPEGVLLLSGNTLYGTAYGGGSSGTGTVFAVNTNGTGFTTLHGFKAISNGGNSDGAYPYSGLILSGNTLYGTAVDGGSTGNGTVFTLNTNGAGFRVLYSFTGDNDGANPFSGLVLSGSALYGTAGFDGSSGFGTVFAVNTNGTRFWVLYSFTGGSDGRFPFGTLILSGDTLYGSTWLGGSEEGGTVFAVNTNGTGFATLYNFYYDGPVAALVLSGNTLYGTAGDNVGGGEGGSSSADGTVFSLSLSAVSAPQLSITLSGANVVLTWASTATGFNLQSTASLVPPAVWTTNSPAPVLVNGQNTVTNLISGKQEFYQLSQ